MGISSPALTFQQNFRNNVTMKEPEHPHKVLLNFFHPYPRRSKVGVELFGATQGVEGVVRRDLYESYADFFVDVNAEQEHLDGADIIVMQHPLYWYSCPALMKEWMDVVFARGYAYGGEKRALAGKAYMHCITTGGSEEAYRGGKESRFTLDELLSPFEQSAHFCGMTYLKPYVVAGTHSITREQISVAAEGYRNLLDEMVKQGPTTRAQGRQE